MPAVVQLLQQLSTYQPNPQEYLSIWQEFSNQPHVFSVVAVVEHQVVGYGSLVIETKIRGGKMAHIEDVVITRSMRNQGIGKAIIQALACIAKDKNCYKMALQCQDHNKAFYEKCGFSPSGTQMQQFLKFPNLASTNNEETN